MGSKIIGLLIKMNRINQNMSQKALCEGICVPSYLSKIENGEIVPTSDILNLLFDVLGITYNDSEEFIEASQNLFERYLERLTFNDFEESSKLFKSIEEQHTKYIHSPLIVDYYIIRLARYCSTSERSLFEEPERILKQVFEQMSSKQRLFFNLYKAIDLLQLTSEYEEALSYLQKGLSEAENGHIYYWLATTYLYQRKALLAVDYAHKALQIYLKDGNVISMMCTYELIARIYMMSGEYEEALRYLIRAKQICSKLNELYFEAYLYNKMAWCYLCLGQLDEAEKYIQKDYYPREKMMKLDPDEVRAFIAYAQQDEDKLQEILEKTQVDAKLKNSKVIQFMRSIRIGKIFGENDDTQTYLQELVKDTEKLPDMQHYLRKMLISYYKYNRKYKEALVLLE